MSLTVTGNLTAADIVSTSAPGAKDQLIITGTPTAGSSVAAVGTDFGRVIVRVSGVFVATFVFEQAIDLTTWVAVGMQNAGVKVRPTVSGTTIGGWQGVLGVNAGFRVRCTSFTSGTAAISIITS